MNKYTYVTSEDIEELASETGIAKLYVEIGQGGIVLREVGVSDKDKVIHAFPSTQYSNGKYGIFDLVPFDESTRRDVTKEVFEQYWQKV